MAAKHLKKVWMEQKKAGKVSGTKKKRVGGTFSTNQCIWQQVSDIIGYKQSIVEFLRIKLGRGSPICKKISTLQIVELCQNRWNSSSMVHKIIQRFRESGDISVHKGQG